MENPAGYEERIKKVLKDFESKIGEIAPEVQSRVRLLLEKELPEISLQKAVFLETEVFSADLRVAMVEYVRRVLNVFYESVSIVDPSLKHIEDFRTMHVEICKSFMYDMQILPAFR
jgi:hypothetical protein